MNSWLALLLMVIWGLCGLSIGYRSHQRKVMHAFHRELYRVRGLYNPHVREAQLEALERMLGKL